MNKRVKKLRLSKDTLRHMDGGALRRALGGAFTDFCTTGTSEFLSCEATCRNTCEGSCAGTMCDTCTSILPNCTEVGC